MASFNLYLLNIMPLCLKILPWNLPCNKFLSILNVGIRPIHPCRLPQLFCYKIAYQYKYFYFDKNKNDCQFYKFELFEDSPIPVIIWLKRSLNIIVTVETLESVQLIKIAWIELLIELLIKNELLYLLSKQNKRLVEK